MSPPQTDAQRSFSEGFALYGDEVHARIKSVADCEEPVRRKILWDNAQKFYNVENPSAVDEARRAAAAVA